jgi:hypothetical protein
MKHVQLFEQFVARQEALCEATATMDALNPDSVQLRKLLKKHRVDMMVGGPAGPAGMTEVTLTGKRKDLEAVLKDPNGWDDEDLADFIEESKNNSYPLNEMDMGSMLTIANALFFIVSFLTIYGFTGEAIDAIKRNIQKLKDIKDKRKINKDSIEDITNDIEGLINDLPVGKRNFLKGLISKLKSTVDDTGNIDKDSALYLQREIDKYATQYGVSKTM